MGLDEALDGVLDRRAGGVLEGLARQLAPRAPEVVAQRLERPALHPRAHRQRVELLLDPGDLQAVLAAATKAMPTSSTLRPTDPAAAMTSGA